MTKYIFSLFFIFSPVIVCADVLDENEAQELTQESQPAPQTPPKKLDGRQVVRINDKDNLVREVEIKDVKEIEDRNPASDEE